MSDSDAPPSPSDRLPEALLERIDSLGISELRAVLSYVEGRIDSLRSPIEEEIEADAAGEILEIEKHGGYALVRMHPPAPDGTGMNGDLVSLYHVRREQRLNGEESLHWAYLGDVSTPEQDRCRTCGRPIDSDTARCPHCGSNGNADSDGGN